MKLASDGGAYQDYVPTAKGRGLFPVLVALRQWGEEFVIQTGENFTPLVDRKDGLPLRKLEIRAQDGRLLDQTDTKVAIPASAQ